MMSPLSYWIVGTTQPEHQAKGGAMKSPVLLKRNVYWNVRKERRYSVGLLDRRCAIHLPRILWMDVREPFRRLWRWLTR